MLVDSIFSYIQYFLMEWSYTWRHRKLIYVYYVNFILCLFVFNSSHILIVKTKNCIRFCFTWITYFIIKLVKVDYFIPPDQIDNIIRITTLYMLLLLSFTFDYLVIVGIINTDFYTNIKTSCFLFNTIVYFIFCPILHIIIYIHTQSPQVSLSTSFWFKLGRYWWYSFTHIFACNIQKQMQAQVINMIVCNP